MLGSTSAMACGVLVCPGLADGETLPATGTGPFPTIVMLHGWGNSKTDFESTSPAGDGNTTFDWNNIYYAQHGYAVLNYTARGWGRSCGSAESRKEKPRCGK